MTTSSDALSTALRHHQAGQLKHAEQICRQLLDTDPSHAGSWHLLGMIALQTGKYGIAADHIARAIQADPGDAAFHCNLGLAYHELGRLEEAVASYRRALEIQPVYSGALNNLGNTFHRQGKLDDAVASYRGAIRIRPDCVDAHYNLGLTLRAQGKLEEAVTCYRGVLQLKPDHAGAHNSLGNVFKEQGRLDEAATSYRLALQVNPNHYQAHYNLGLTLRDRNQLDEAIACYRRALAIKPDYAQAHNNLGNILGAQGKLDEAAASCRRAISIWPDYAQAHRNLGIILLLMGEMPTGWAEYEWRLRCEDAAVSPQCQPVWNGSPLDGRTIMLFGEQGMGDTIQFVRYARLLRKRGGVVLLECQPSLSRLLESCPDVDQLVPRGTPLPAFDVACPLMSLPAILETTLQTIPADVPYLDVVPTLVQRWRAELGTEGFQVGIAWQGNQDYPEDQWRSVPLARFEPLARVKEVKLISLQKGPAAQQASAVGFPIIDLSDRLDEQSGPFMDTAAVIKHLDLVVTCDTAIAHLAGALGVPVWVALPLVPNWRWLLDGEQSPWYPSMRLFRQKEPGNWQPVFERIAVALEKEIPSAARSAAPPSESAHMNTADVSATGPIRVEIEPGELIDKITILEIKTERIGDPEKLRNIVVELTELKQARDGALRPIAALDQLTGQLKAVNEALWQVEDEVRDCERQKDFGPRFIELAHSVYSHNDRRCALKRQINLLLGTRLVEEKSYAPTGEPEGGQPMPHSFAPSSTVEDLDTPATDAGQDDERTTGGEPWINTRYIRLKGCRHGPMIYIANDRYIGQSLDRYGEFSEGELKLFKQLLRPGHVVLDIGANIGTHTVFFAQTVGPAGAVYAFEPQRVPHQILSGNIAINALTNVHAWQSAVGRESGTVQVPVLNYDRAGNFGGLSLSGQVSGETVPKVTIDQLDFAACHMIKIDVEGMEAEAISGAEHTIRRLRPMLYVENDRAEKSAPLIAELFALDYRLYWHLPLLFNPNNYFKEPENLFPGIVSANMLGLHRSVTQNVALREIRTPDDTWNLTGTEGGTH